MAEKIPDSHPILEMFRSADPAQREQAHELLTNGGPPEVWRAVMAGVSRELPRQFWRRVPVETPDGRITFQAAPGPRYGAPDDATIVEFRDRSATPGAGRVNL